MKKIILLLLLFTSTISFSQTKKLASLDAAKEASRNWSQLFLQGKYAEMFDEMKPYWPIPAEKVDEMKGKTVQFKDVIRQNYGNPIDVIRISGENLADVAYREVYFLRHDKSTLRAIFVYYNNGNGWLLSSFEWDDSFSKEFAQEH
jgi:hypothetical protein